MPGYSLNKDQAIETCDDDDLFMLYDLQPGLLWLFDDGIWYEFVFNYHIGECSEWIIAIGECPIALFTSTVVKFSCYMEKVVAGLQTLNS